MKHKYSSTARRRWAEALHISENYFSIFLDTDASLNYKKVIFWGVGFCKQGRLDWTCLRFFFGNACELTLMCRALVVSSFEQLSYNDRTGLFCSCHATQLA